MKKILITGAKGQLGSELNKLSIKYPQFEWIFTDWKELDLCNLERLPLELTKISPQYIINCAAHTAVDKAETERELSNTLNNLSAGVLAKWSNENKCKLIHISTDYVFDGTASTALKETAETNPINVYGETKLAGEKACFAENKETVLIRTSWVYSAYGNNFVKTMMRLMKEKESLNVVKDQIGSPTYAADLAQAIMTIITYPKWEAGIYHFSNEGVISWYEFALAIKEIGGYKCNINGIPTSEYPTPAKRPQYSLLDKSKIKSTYGVVVPEYKESLRVCINLLIK